MPAEIKGFTLVERHRCLDALPNANEFHEEHPDKILVCDHCGMKWAVQGSSGDLIDWHCWWVEYQGLTQ